MPPETISLTATRFDQRAICGAAAFCSVTFTGRRPWYDCTSEAQSFQSAKQRCDNPNNRAYKDYGGRGILFKFSSIAQFLDEIGLNPEPGILTLDRIDNDGHYQPGNVRWATKEQQSNNQRPRRKARPKREAVDMAFEIGERVTSSFMGPGTVIGPFERDDDNTPVQRIHFDHPLLGERLRPIGKLQTLEPEDEPKAKKTRKLSDIQKLQSKDPQALHESKQYGPCIYIYCQPSIVSRESSRSGIDEKYIKPTTEFSNGAKYDILFTKVVPEALMARLAAEIKDVDIVNNRICSRGLALWLVSEGVMPEVPVSETKIQKAGGDGSKA